MNDLISRQAAIDAIHEDILLKPLNGSWYRENHEFVTVGYVERTLLAVPSAQPERKKGRWYDVGSLSCRCSECGCKSSKEYSFCPNCGADMRGEEDEQ